MLLSGFAAARTQSSLTPYNDDSWCACDPNAHRKRLALPFARLLPGAALHRPWGHSALRLHPGCPWSTPLTAFDELGLPPPPRPQRHFRAASPVSTMSLC